jgi:hypothetical protein
MNSPLQCIRMEYDATGIVTAAREYRAGRAVVEFTVGTTYVLHHVHDE